MVWVNIKPLTRNYLNCCEEKHVHCESQTLWLTVTWQVHENLAC